MALATQCPHCNTLFRVAHDQLKLRGGIVRCGACNEIFDGNAALIEVAAGDTPPAPTPASKAAAVSAGATDHAADEIPVYTLDFASTFDPLGILPKGENEQEKAETAPPEAAPEPELDLDFNVDDESTAPPVAEAPIDIKPPLDRIEPRLDMVLDEPPAATPPQRIEPVLSEPEPAPEPAPEPEPASAPLPAMEEEDDAGIVIDLPPDVPPDLKLDLAVTDTAPAESAEEPGFIKRDRQRAKLRRVGRVLMAVGSVLLLLGALGQTVRQFRNELAAQYSPLRPTLVAACKVLACQVALPTQIRQLSIDVGELQTLPGGMFLLDTQLHNQSGMAQAWPHIDLVLIDGADKPLLRRVVTPAEYLSPVLDPSRGFAARSDQTVKLYFSLDRVQASGYRIAVFYP